MSRRTNSLHPGLRGNLMGAMYAAHLLIGLAWLRARDRDGLAHT